MDHIHGIGFVDLPFAKSIRNELVNDGRALPYPVLPNSGWLAFLINDEEDITVLLIRLFCMQYKRLDGSGNPRSISTGAQRA